MVTSKLKKIPSILRTEGLPGIFRRLSEKFFACQYFPQFQHEYSKYYELNKPTLAGLEAEKRSLAAYKLKPLVSIITPTFNTPTHALEACIESVINQTYEFWEMIVVDDASSDPEVWNTLQAYSSRDKRIKIQRRKQNDHICAASNDALAMTKGEWIALLDHDDVLWPNALYEVVKRINEHPESQFIYSDEDKLAKDGKTHVEPFFKPDWSPHFLRSINYITHFTCIRKDLVDAVGGFRLGTEGAQDWELFLRATNLLESKQCSHPWLSKAAIQHIPKILYSWRKSATSTSSSKHAFTAKSYAYEAQERVLRADIDSRGGGSVVKTKYIGVLKVLPKIQEIPLVSIIIPTKNNLALLKPCIESIYSLSTYTQFELCVVDTGSNDTKILDYYSSLLQRSSIQIINWDKTFNYSAVVNLGVAKTKGDYLLFLNDDTVVRTPDWIEQMLAFAQLDNVGAVGCRLLYPNGSIQHTGLVLGVEEGEVLGERGFVSNYFRTARPEQNYGIASLLTDTVRDVSAVTAAAMMIGREKHSEIGGFDEALAIAFNDVDYCLKLQKLGLYNVINPEVVLTHHESVSLGKPGEHIRDLAAFKQEIQFMKKRWGTALELDHYFQGWQLIDGLIYPYVQSKAEQS